jgi:hypothetical protein
MQQGILFHTLYASEPGVYCAQWSCTLHGNLQALAFKQAWQRVVDRHPVLRTAFNWELLTSRFKLSIGMQISLGASTTGRECPQSNRSGSSKLSLETIEGTALHCPKLR